MRRPSARAGFIRAVAAGHLDASTSSPRKRSQRKTVKGIDREIKRIEKRLVDQDWEGLTAGDLVSVYAWCHRELYGVTPADLSGAAWSHAQRMAGAMVKREFGGDVEAALDFMRWVWKREQKRVEWRRSNSAEPRRITWQEMFIRKFHMVDYQVAENGALR